MKKNAAQFVSECAKLGINTKVGDQKFMSVFIGADASWTSHGREAQGFLVNLTDIMTKATGRNPSVKELKKTFDSLRRLVNENADPKDFYTFADVLRHSAPHWVIEHGGEVMLTNVGRDWLAEPAHPMDDPLYIKILTEYLE